MSSIGLTATSSGAQEASKSVISGVNVQTAPVYVGNAEYEELTPEDSVNVTVGVFFDGTQNNRKNTEARIEHEKNASDPTRNNTIAAQYIFEDGSSFENDYSNVSRGEPHYEKKDEEKHKQLSVYIEGIGTENYGKDSWFPGVALGQGETGVPAKVKKGCEDTAKEIHKALKNGGILKIDTLTIDTFGFSRGAAAARNFVYEVTKRKDQIKTVIPGGKYSPPTIIRYEVNFGPLGEFLKEKGIEVKTLAVRYVGLYDTVASYGITHGSDTQELHLNAISKARHVFHIGADDEHRANFRRTDIKSAGTKGKEVLFPGVHSDIGGGYLETESETAKVVFKSHFLNKGRAEQQYLIDQGWYETGELVLDQWNGHLKATRTNISNRYSFIPLHCMSEYGKTKAVDFDISKIKRSYKIEEAVLVWAKGELDKYIAGNRDKLSFDNPADRENIKQMRHDYFHFSAHYDGRKLGFIYPNEPNREDGIRTRVINEG